jgi:predicted site-specific integrase-resolvase
MRVPISDIGPEGLLTLGQAAYLLQIASQTAGYWVKQGRLKPTEQTGAGPMFRRRDVEAFAKVREAEKTARAKRAAAKQAKITKAATKRSAVG